MDENRGETTTKRRREGLTTTARRARRRKRARREREGHEDEGKGRNEKEESGGRERRLALAGRAVGKDAAEADGVVFEIMGGGLVTLERAKVIRYQDQGKR